MPQGIIIRDEQGNVTLDTTTATGIILGSRTISGSQQFTVNNIEFGISRPFYLIVASIERYRRNKPTVTFNGSNMIIQGNDPSNTGGAYTVFYGVY
ncbi:MAG: hypothetical protein L0G09_08820 [Acinetobacter sp.]|nr:hypothetical protein [Acinetobacter sp.]MDN6081662.1 hypothetical protein [Leuconostoc sp.]MDN5433908.1 hypothetical protein [Acinetobacter sp.]MDN5490170.1 hypothetical protein [Acinetobacter sp.]MDN5650627.1 hypothetical protein [Acinetobacter sp.]